MAPNKSISVGICAHNEEETIGELLEQLGNEEVEIEEIIVVVAGYDNTDEIVREKATKYSHIQLIKEEERNGQSAAQNLLLSENSSDILFLIDGDGTIEEGSLNKMLQEFNGKNIILGREIPDTPDNMTGKIISSFWEIHHSMCKINPKFTTQLALIPGDLIESIPPEIVIDDEYIAIKALEKGYSISYVPSAKKYHNIKGDLKSFTRHRIKNWTGMFQMQNIGYENIQPTDQKAKFFLKYFRQSSWRNKPVLIAVGAIELLSVTMAVFNSIRGHWPYKWKR